MLTDLARHQICLAKDARLGNDDAEGALAIEFRDYRFTNQVFSSAPVDNSGYRHKQLVDATFLRRIVAMISALLATRRRCR